jgi:hypothetical protein
MNYRILITACVAILAALPLRAADAPPAPPAPEAPEAPEAPPAPETARVAYLGVVTGRVSSSLRVHLPIPEGAGLTVRHVAEGSAAEAAGLRQHDILLRMDDQLLVNEQQLRVLLRNHQPGDRVRLALLRAGAEIEVEVELGGRAAEKRAAESWRDWIENRGWERGEAPPIPDVPGLEGLFGPDGELAASAGELARNIQVLVEDGEEGMIDLSQLRDDLSGLREKLIYLKADHNLDGLDEIINRHVDGSRTTVIAIADKEVAYTGPEGRIALTHRDGQPFIAYRSADGTQQYAGPLPEDPSTVLPPDAAARLKKLQSSQAIDFTAPDDVEVELDIEVNGRAGN